MDTYEKKYKEIVGKIRKAYLFAQTDSTKAVLEEIFPELKESEDERIRKELLDYCKNRAEKYPNDPKYKDISAWIAWLEKQGEQPRYSIGDVLCDKSCTTLNKDAQPNFEIVDIRNGMYICDKGSFPISQQDEYELVAKKIEQNLADIVEPKFHEGDWIIFYKDTPYGNTPFKVLKIEAENNGILNYLLLGQNGCDSFYNKKYVDENARLWTIQDAKDGDVLVGSKGDVILMFRGIGNTEWDDVIDYHCYYDCYHEDFSVQEDVEHWGRVENSQLKPATKEQRNILFQKMKEAGYEWDAEKKILKEIENEIEIPFGAKDSELQEATYYIPKGFHAEIDNDKVVIKKGEKPAEWSEEDALRLEEVICMIEANGRWVRSDDALKLVLDWLKSIRPRIMGLK